MDTNPAMTNRAVGPLPEDEGSRDQQFWTAGKRDALMRYADQQVNSALEQPVAPRPIIRTRMRDRAIVTLLALSGVRRAEVFSAPRDDRRNGITWNDVDLEGQSIQVLGKSRDIENAPLPTRAARALERYRDVVEPPTEAWPVFLSRHAASLHRAFREGSEFTESKTERLLEQNDVGELLCDHEIAPPSLSTNGARSVMQRICEKYDFEIDGDAVGGSRSLSASRCTQFQTARESVQRLIRRESLLSLEENNRSDGDGRRTP